MILVYEDNEYDVISVLGCRLYDKSCINDTLFFTNSNRNIEGVVNLINSRYEGSDIKPIVLVMMDLFLDNSNTVDIYNKLVLNIPKYTCIYLCVLPTFSSEYYYLLSVAKIDLQFHQKDMYVTNLIFSRRE